MAPEQNCNIERGSSKSEILLEAKLLIMDEVTMMSKVDLERIDRTLRFLTGKDKPFGGKIILLSGDFRQILPVEKNTFDACNTCLKASYLWDVIQQLPLSINERVRQFGGHPSYSTFLMYLGLGLLKERNEHLHHKFKEYRPDEFIRFPKKIGGENIIGKYESINDFVADMFPNLETSNEIPESIILTPKKCEHVRLTRSTEFVSRDSKVMRKRES